MHVASVLSDGASDFLKLALGTIGVATGFASLREKWERMVLMYDV